jgi:hypothetical protein
VKSGGHVLEARSAVGKVAQTRRARSADDPSANAASVDSFGQRQVGVFPLTG